MEEQLRKLLSGITELKLADDADFDYIGELETQVIRKLREPIDQMAAQGMTQAPPSMAQTQAPGNPLLGMAGQGGISPSTDTAPAADELRRLMMSR